MLFYLKTKIIGVIKMKKIFVFILLIFLSCLFGCKQKENAEMINIEFKIQDISKKTEINKGSTINKKNIPFLKNLDISGLYLDETKENKYNNEPVNEELTIYVELKEKDYTKMNEDEILLQIRNDYLNQCVIPSFGEEYTIDGINYYKYTIDDVDIYSNFGCYNGSYVIWFSVTGKGVGWNLLTEYVVGGVSLVFPTAKIPYVWNNGYFYYLETAYDKGLLTINNLEAIAKRLKGEE